VGPDNRWYVCPREWSNGRRPCPICEYRQKLKEDPDADKKAIDALAPSRRQLFNVIDTKHRDKGVQIWDFSYHLFGKLLVTYLEKRQEKLKNWCEFEGGMTLTLGLEKRTFEGNKFVEVKMIDFDERKKDYDGDEMLTKVHCLDELIKVPSYDELKKVFMQTGEDTDGNGTKKFRSSDMQNIKEMDEKELQKFVIINDIDVDSDDYPDLEDFQAAVIKKVKAAIAEDEDGDEEPKAGKKNAKKTTTKSSKKKSDDDEEPEESEDEEPEEEEENEAPESEEGSQVQWDDDGEERTGTVTDINTKKGTCTIDGDDGEEYKKVELSDLTLVENEESEEEPEIEKGSEVKWTDDDQDDHVGTVLKIKGDTATVQEGKKKYEVEVSELTLAD